MSERMRQDRTAVKVPTSGASDLIAVRLEERRPELAQHNPASIGVTAAALVAIRDVANGSTPSLRADRQVRYRLLQFDGAKALPFEDLVAVALENAVGQDAVLEGLRVLLGALGYEIQPTATAPIDLAEATATYGEDVQRIESDVLRHAPAEVLRRDMDKADMDACRLRAAARFAENEKRGRR